MKFRPNLFDRLIRTVGPRAVGQEGDRDPAIGIDPERGARISQMAVGIWAEILAGLRGGRGSVPSKRARRTGGSIASGEEVDSFRAHD